MNGALTAGALVILIFGWLLGWRGERARASYRYYRTVKARASGLRQTARSNAFRFLRLVAVATFVGAVIVQFLRNLPG